MKKSFKSMAEKADPKTLDPFFADIDRDEVGEDTVSRIEAKVLGSSAPEKRRGAFRRWIPVIAACLVIAAGAAIGIGMLNRRSPAPSIPSEGNIGYGEISLSVSKESKDKFSKDYLLADGPASEVAADRDLYCGIRFYESGGSTYMIYREGGHVFKYENGSFTDTGICPAERQFFTSGSYNGYAYVGGIFHCCGGNEKGLFRVDLRNSTVEKVIDCKETVSSVAVEGSKIYYSTYTGHGSLTNDLFSLKCADIEKREISTIISGAKYSIGDLQLVDGNLYFNSYGEGIRCITPDMTLRNFQTGYNRKYTVDHDTIYTYREKTVEADDGTSYFLYSVSAYDMQGEMLGYVENRKYPDERGDDGRQKKYYVGSLQDGITVYNGKVVYFDAEGIWLEDVITGKAKKITDDPFGFSDRYSYNYVSKTVYDGKLFISWQDTKDGKWSDMLIVYDGRGIRTVTLK